MVESTGLQNFLQLFEADTPLAVLAAKAPVGFVTGALADTYELRQLVEEGSVRPFEERTRTGRWASIVQLHDDPWSYVLWAVGSVTGQTQAGLGLFAEDLTATLGTEAVSLLISVDGIWSAAGDVDGPAFGFCVYRDGEAVERAVISAAGEVLGYEHDEHESLAESGGESGLEVFERVLERLGLYLPPCVPDGDGDESRLRIADLEPARVRRCDLLEGNLSLPAEEETLDMKLEESPDGTPRVQANGDAEDPEPADEKTSDEAAPGEASSDDDTRVMVRPESSDRSPGLLGRLRRWITRTLR